MKVDEVVAASLLIETPEVRAYMAMDTLVAALIARADYEGAAKVREARVFIGSLEVQPKPSEAAKWSFRNIAIGGEKKPEPDADSQQQQETK